MLKRVQHDKVSVEYFLITKDRFRWCEGQNIMKLHELAGKPAPQSILENIPRLIAAYYTYKPDVSQDNPSRCLWNLGTQGIVSQKQF